MSSVNSSASELLDLLEREVDAPSTKDSNIKNNRSNSNSRRSIPYHQNNESASSANDEANYNDGKKLRRRRGSETSLDSSFTSKLLGGYADDNDDDDDDPLNHPQPVQQQFQPPHIDEQNDNNTTIRSLKYNEDHDVDTNTLAVNTIESNDNSSFSESQQGNSRTRRKSQQQQQQQQSLTLASSFDNPFHRGSISSNSLNRLIESKNVDNINNVSNQQGSYSDVGGGRHRGSGNSDDQTNEEGKRAKKIDILLQTKHDRSSNDRGGKVRGGHQHSVSFSVEDDWKDREVNCTTSNNTNTRDKKSTFTPSSLGSLISYASTRSSYSGRSSSGGGGGSRSSKSSRGSGASTATGSTHSSGSNHSPHAQQERRRRRELTPIKKIAKVTKTSRTTTAIANSNYAGEMVMLMGEKGEDGGNGAIIGHASPHASGGGGNSSSIRRSRRNEISSAIDSIGGAKGLASSRNLYNSRQGLGNMAGGGTTQYGKNLHEHHPVRYPRRSCDDDDDEEDDNYDEDRSDAGDAEKGRTVASRTKNGTDATDAIAMGDAFGLGEDNIESTIGDEEGGLFQRVNNVRNELLLSKSNKKEQSDFFDGLIKSTTRQSGLYLNSSTKEIIDDVNDNDGAASVGETSFLSDFLTKNSVARQRKAGQLDQKSIHAGGSTTSSIINIYKKHDDGTQKTQQHQYQQLVSQGIQCLRNFLIKFTDHVMSMIRRSPVRQYLERYYDEGGDILPRNRWEIAVILVWALIILPLVRVAVIHVTHDSDVLKSGLGGPSLLISADGDDVIADVWKESSIAMLSKSSSMLENFILIPDTVWIELQISRSKMQSSDNDSIKLPKRLPLPSVIDHDYSSPSSMVLFYITAVNSTSLLLSNNVNPNPSKRNIRLNTRLFESMQERLKPRPVDVWPCWAHNSIAHFREDGLIAMFPAAKRREARVTIKRLANAFGQSTIYEFITTSDRAKSERRVGSDGSDIIIPGLRNGRSDVLIRRSLSTDPSDKDGAGPVVVMRRVKNLAVEDELTVREWEGPPLDQVVWNRGYQRALSSEE